jgi:hypothetical protein
LARIQANSELSHFTCLITGAHLDPEVAELLNATAIAAGYESLAKFDATQITQARYRYPLPRPAVAPKKAQQKPS